MQTIPADILEQYSAVLKKRAVPVFRHADYRKWLRYFLDFRSKYPLPEPRSEQVRLFIRKLQEKKQSPEQQKQAAHALSLFFESENAETKAAAISTSSQYRATTEGLPLQVSEAATTPSTPFVKGEYSNLSKIGHGDFKPSVPRASLHPFVPLSSSGSHYNEWRCLKKSASPAWDKIIESLAAEIKVRHYSRKTLKSYADWSRQFQS